MVALLNIRRSHDILYLYLFLFQQFLNVRLVSFTVSSHHNTFLYHQIVNPSDCDRAEPHENENSLAPCGLPLLLTYDMVLVMLSCVFECIVAAEARSGRRTSQALSFRLEICYE